MRIVIAHNVVAEDAPADELDTLVQVEAIGGALAELGHQVTVVPCTLNLEALKHQLEELQPQAVFNLVEALGGSDRLHHLVPALLDALHIPYTGSPTESLWFSSSKLLAKQRLRAAGLPTPDWEVLPGAAGAMPAGKGGMPPGDADAQTYIIKTVFEHGSFGIRDDAVLVKGGRAEIHQRLREAHSRLGRECFAERFIEGREFNVPLLTAAETAGPSLGTAQPPPVEVLPPSEIDFRDLPPGKPRVVGYHAKWDATSFEYEHTPRRFDFSPADRPLLERLTRLATECWSLFGARGYARVDFRVDAAGDPWILETNTNPCLSPDAGFAASLEQAGITFPRAIDRILQDALARPR